MSLTIGKNIASLQAQRRLNAHTDAIGSVYERLSSGQRINKASDDAAGLAIAESLNSDSRVFNQGVRNLNDGISLLNIAESSVENLSTILIRLEELAQQASNGVLGSSQRKALDAEAQALSKEFTRIARSTSFNGQNIFTGENPTLQLQAGFGNNAIINTSVGGAIGTGQFNTATTLNFSNAKATASSTGDFNGDGFLDMTKTSNTGVLTTILGDGNGGFQSGSITGASTGVVSALGTGDFNGDGILDHATIGSTGIFLSLGNGDGTFVSPASVAGTSAANIIKVGDINNDGLDDIVTGNTTTGAVQMYLASGSGNFATASTVYNAGAGNIGDIALADFDNDGNLDISASEILSNRFKIINGNGNGTFQGTVQYNSGNWNNIVTGDFNGDGYIDLAGVGTGDGNLAINLNDGDGTFVAYTTSAFGSAGQLGNLSVADFNGDGLLDVAASNASDNTIRYKLGSGDGNFASTQTLSLSATAVDVNLADYNRDGVTDIFALAVGTNSSSLSIANTVNGVSPLEAFSLSSIAGAKQALPVFQNRLEKMSIQRGVIGANQSRLGYATNVLLNTRENYSSAESQIRSADIAHEASQLVRLSILQKSTSAILAQANQQSELLLKLLA